VPKIRAAAAEDANAIGRIQVETWTTAYAGLLPQATIDAFDVDARQAMWREGLGRESRPGSATFVALVDDEIVGFASVGASHSEEGTGELYAIYVHPARWGLGAGRALMDRAEASMRDSGFPAALLWVLEGNERAERFYRTASWERDGEKVDDFQGATVTEVRYRKQL
jgi:ribosomal protein S18 acetylase RimI-like enzyme